MIFKKKTHTIEIRPFEPLTASSNVVERKKKLRDKIKNDIKNLDEIRDFCHDQKLSISVNFFLFDSSKSGNPQSEGRTKKDLDNLLKIVLDVLPEKMDSEGTNDGLGLIKRDYDHLVYEIKSTKQIVYDQNDEGIIIEISQWKN